MNEDLRTWFKQRWVNLARKKKSGGFEPCGTSGEKGQYAKCVPAGKAASMSAKEIKSAIRRKRAAQKAAGRPGKEQPGQGNKPIMVKTMKEENLQEKNKPTNAKLWSKAKSLAKSKFDVYPSAYANAWAAKWYRSKGGGWRTVSEELGKENEWGTKALTRKYKKMTPGQCKEEVDIESETAKVNLTLNPAAWDGLELKSDVRDALLKVAQKFIDSWEFLIPVEDIIITGSNANYNWTQYSDFDLHVIVNMKGVPSLSSDFIRLFLKMKKTLWNKQHNIKIKGFDVEVYAQDKTEPHYSTGVYSLKQNQWLIQPQMQLHDIDHPSVRRRAEDMMKDIDKVLMSRNEISINNMLVKIAELRKEGLTKGGEFSTENLIFKVLRNSGYIQKLYDALGNVVDRSLSIDEKYYPYKLNRRKHKYGKRSVMMANSAWESRKKLRAQLAMVKKLQKRSKRA